jgi:putative ABC transport system permease protein
VINGAVVWWTAATTIATSILFGVAPAFLSIGESTVDALRTGIRTAAGSPVARRLRSAIVVGQIGTSFVFLVAAALLVRSFVTLTRFDVGYDARGLAVATISVTRKPEPADVAATERALLTAVQSVPSVSGAALGGAVLQTDIRPGPFVIHRTLGDETLDLDMCETPFVSPGYFRVMGIPLIRGRTFENDDDLIVNQKFARRFWPNGDALGARLRVGGGAKARWLTVVGIAGDVNMPGVSELFTMQMYRPASTAGHLNMISFRARRNPEALEAEVGRAISASGVSATLSSIRGVESVLDTRVLARPRFALVLFGVFASIALLLTAVGLYSVVAYTVTHRTREIGVRVALGADAAAVTRMILADGMRHVASGVVLGVVVAFATTHLLTSFLYNGNASDPRAFAGAAIVLAAVTLVASSIPLRRALGVAPIDALRSD